MIKTAIDWHGLDDIEGRSVPANPTSGIWTPVLDYVSGPRIIRIAAGGEWKPIDFLSTCTADGFHHWAFGRDTLLTKKAPLGALIGKIGGSNMSTDEGEIFPVGSYTVVTLEKQTGPLYLTINDAPGFFDDNSGELTVKIKAD